MEQAKQLRDHALQRFQEVAKAKYDKGQATYRDYLADRVTLDDIEEEVIDQWFYLQALKAKLKELNLPSLTRTGE